MLTEIKTNAWTPLIRYFAAQMSGELLFSAVARLFRSPGVYALISAPLAVLAVFSPRAAPDWFFLLCLVFGVLALLLALWTVSTLSLTLRRYRAEALGFDPVVRGLARAARGFFRAGQFAALALAFGLSFVFSLLFPGLAVLAAQLVLSLAIALAALPGALLVPRHADAGLALLVRPQTFPLVGKLDDRFRIAWRFAARMGAVRAAVADRQAVLPLEARDISKALDGGGMVRPPVHRLSLDPFGVLWLRGRGLAVVFAAAFPIALVAWLLAALMPPGTLPVLPGPADLWAFATSEDAATPDAFSDPEAESSKNQPGQEGSPLSADSGSDHEGGAQQDAVGANGSGGGQGAVLGSDGAGQAGGGQPDGAGSDGSGGGQGAAPGSDGAGQTGEDQPGSTGSDGAGQADGGQPGGAGSDGSRSGQSAAMESDGAEQTVSGQPGGDGSALGGSADGVTTAVDAESEPKGGTDGSAKNGAGSGDGMTSGYLVDTTDPAGNNFITGDGSGGDPGNVIVPGSGEGEDVEGRLPSAPVAEGGEELEIGTPPSLFAPPGSAPPVVFQDLSWEAVTEMPPGPSVLPRQRLPAWIAELYK